MPAIEEDPEEERLSGREALVAALRTRVQLWVVIGLLAVAFGAGVAVSQIAQRSAPGPVDDVGVGVDVPVVPGDVVEAPPLSEEQLQEGLPEGHPSVGTDAPTGEPTEEPTAGPSGTAEASP